jgi:hypothetical protein
VLRNVWAFEECSAREIDAFDHLKVDVHVERHLPATLELFLLWRFLLVPACMDVWVWWAENLQFDQWISQVSCEWTLEMIEGIHW